MIVHYNFFHMFEYMNFPTNFQYISEYNNDDDYSLKNIEDTQDCNVQFFPQTYVYGKKLLIINIIEQLQHVNIHQVH